MNLHFRFTLTDDDDRAAVAQKLFELSQIVQDSVQIAGPHGWDYAIQAHKGDVDTTGTVGKVKLPDSADAKAQLAGVIEAWEREPELKRRAVKAARK